MKLTFKQDAMIRLAVILLVVLPIQAMFVALVGTVLFSLDFTITETEALVIRGAGLFLFFVGAGLLVWAGFEKE